MPAISPFVDGTLNQMYESMKFLQQSIFLAFGSEQLILAFQLLKIIHSPDVL